MARPKSTRPTDGELEILQVIWDLGVCTVRDVHDVLSVRRPVAQTTISTMMQIMANKGQLVLADERRPQKYRATTDPKKTYDTMLKDLIKRLFGGSAKKMVMHVITGKKASAQQIEQMEKMLDDLE